MKNKKEASASHKRDKRGTVTLFGERIFMHIGIVRCGISVLMLCLCSFCQKGNVSKDSLLKMNGKTITKHTFESFDETRSMYPALRGDFFSRPLSDMTYFITINAIYENVRSQSFASKLKSSDDWKWKQQYYPAQLYLKNIINTNLGFSDKEIDDYYKANRQKYSRIIPADTTKKDTLQKGRPVVAKKDSIVYLPLQEVKNKIVETLFLKQNPIPDSVYRKDPKDTSRIDSNAVKSDWIYAIRRTGGDFFLKALYQEKFPKKTIDSLNEWYGEKKFITPNDMKIIISWLPEDQRGYYSAQGNVKDMAKWLLRWKLYSEKAAKTGYSSLDEVKAVLDWALKIDIAYAYVNQEMVPAAKKSAVVDTAMCLFAYWDDHGNALAKPDSFGIWNVIDQYKQKQANMEVDSRVQEMRKKLNVTLLQSDFKDDAGGNPVTLIMHADSLRDTGNTNEAESIYELLAKQFLFTPEGMRSLIEVAKIKTERQQYSMAIQNYRDYLVLSKDKSKRCNTFFMIGFIFDEYLNKPEDARINYRWVLKNTPDCELTDDAEFMSLHLGEAMNSVEELRAEALRQGKKVDTSAIPETPSDTMKKAKTK
jgi:hypothetical protein